MNINILNEYVEEKMGMPFEWGTNDCNTFLAGYVDHVKGTNWLEVFKGKYKNKFGAIRFQKKYGKRPSEVLQDEGLEQISVYDVRVGDILIKKDKIYEMTHIVINNKCVSVDEEIGTAPIPISDLKTFDLAYRFKQ